MLPLYPENLKYGSLENLYTCIDRCNLIIERAEDFPDSSYPGYARIAKVLLPGYKNRINELRAEGKKTAIEQINECTGNTFIPLHGGRC